MKNGIEATVTELRHVLAAITDSTAVLRAKRRDEDVDTMGGIRFLNRMATRVRNGLMQIENQSREDGS